MKIVIDILMFILMLLEFSKSYMLPIYHEIIGVILLILLFIHLLLNIKYLKNIFNGKYNRKRYIVLFINIGFFITFITSIILGILSSQELLKFMNIGNINIINLHKIFSYINLIFLGMHLGINFNAMFKFINNSSIVTHVINFLIIIYGIYSFIKLDILKHLVGEYGFGLIEGNIVINIIRYLSIVMMIAIVINYFNKRRKNER